MVQVLGQRARPAPLAAPGPAASRHREQVRATNGAKPAYKVVMEETLKPKKKLLTSSFSQQEPPPGYTFVAAGDPQLTTQCKELARKEGLRIYVVSTTKHQDTQLSLEVHRIGWHFPSSIVERACTSLGISLTSQGQVVRPREQWPTEKPRKNQSRKGLSRIDKKALKNLRQGEVDREAKEAIKDLFPAIPQEDLDVIVSRAFELGTKKVGAMVDELSLPRRVQLAVVAHIRHIYTDYDNLLQHFPWMTARSHVENLTLEKLAQWRGEKDTDDPDAMEEILQEVIVIPDEDDEPELEDKTVSVDHSTKYTTDRERRRPSPVHERLQIRASPVDYGRLDPSERRSASPHHLEMRGVKHLGNGQYILAPNKQEWPVRARDRQEHVWKEALRRVRGPQYQEVRRVNQLPQYDDHRYGARQINPPSQGPLREIIPRSNHAAGLIPHGRPNGPVLLDSGIPSLEGATTTPRFEKYYERSRALPSSPQWGASAEYGRQGQYAPAYVSALGSRFTEPLSPSDVVLPSVEPSTPRRDRPFAGKDTESQRPRVVLINSANGGDQTMRKPPEQQVYMSNQEDHEPPWRRYPVDQQGRAFAAPARTAESSQRRQPTWHDQQENAPPAPGRTYLPVSHAADVPTSLGPSAKPTYYRAPSGIVMAATQEPNGRPIHLLRTYAGQPRYDQDLRERSNYSVDEHKAHDGWVSSTLIRGADGRLYEKRVTHQPERFADLR